MIKINYQKIYYYSFLIFAFILPLSRAGLTFFSIFLLLVWFLEGNFREKIQKITTNRLLFSLFLFILWSYLSALWSEDINNALEKVGKYRYLFIPFIFYTSSLDLNKKYINRLIDFFLAGMFVSEIIAYGVFFKIWKFKHATPLDPSPFMIHMDYSVFLAFTSILLFNRFISKEYPFYKRTIYFLFFLTVTGNLFLQGGRTGQVAYIFAIIVMFILHYKISLKSIFSSLVSLVLIFSIGYYFSKTFQTRINAAKNNINRIYYKKDFRNNLGKRASYWILTYNILSNDTKALFFGKGLGDYKLAIADELKNNRYKKMKIDKKYLPKHHPHNQYLAILLQSGIIGLILFICIAISIIKKSYPWEELRKIAILFVVVFYIGCLAEPLLFKQFTLALYSFFVGIFSL